MRHNVDCRPFSLPPEVLVLDLETQLGLDHSPRAVDGATIYASGHLQGVDQEGTPSFGSCCLSKDEKGEWFRPSIYLAPFKLLVGHNIKFDLEHIFRSKLPKFTVTDNTFFVPLKDWLREKATVWDTQYLTYLKSGHSMKFSTLEESLAYWGVKGAAKTFDIGEELKKADWDISKVPNLIEYLHNDVRMTADLFNIQLKDPWVIENMAWILAMMQGLLGTFEIEFNGMKVDHDALTVLEAKAAVEVVKAKDAIYVTVFNKFGTEMATVFNPASPKQLGTLLYGGDFKYEVKVPCGTYKQGSDKAGQPKFKTEKRVLHIPTAVGLTGTSTDDDALASIESSSHLAGYRTKLAQAVRHLRSWSKLQGTYLEGLRKHLKMNEEGEVYVYPQINLCLTDTGRTSASKPNIQNNPTHDLLGVKSIYTSRFGEEGCFVEVDFKQIEVLALAHISGDETLLDDLKCGRDIHAETGKGVYTGKLSKEQRRIIKTINFGLIYGGGAAQLATQAGVPVGVAMKVINAFYHRYPQTKIYFESFRKKLQNLMDCHGKPNGAVIETPIGPIAQKSVEWESLTGRRYTFADYWSDFSKKTEVSYTQSRNYPIQGLATGDMVLNALGYVWRHTLPQFGEDIKLIGLIHDSLVFDIKACRLDELMRELKYSLGESGNLLNAVCPNLKWDLPVKVEFSTGPTLGTMREITA